MTDIEDKKLKLINSIRNRCNAQIEEIVAFQDRSVTAEEVEKILKEDFERTVSRIPPSVGFTVNEDDFKILKFQLCQRAVTVSEENRVTGLSGQSIPPWLEKKKVNWRFWSRYKTALLNSGVSDQVVAEHERLLRRALDMSGDPTLQGPWSPRKGLIMGNVQSGKTMNFIGLVNKALDVGYHIIVILGGHMDELRNQAQRRLDRGLPDVNEFPVHEQVLIPHSLTSVDHDFSSGKASVTSPNLHASPSVLVMKKNTKIIERFIKWMSDDSRKAATKKPFLLIDDEADYASINTKYAKSDYTSTNAVIRELLGIFERPTYVGYTATPFANVFIPFKETVSGDFDDDLFPSDFMLKMPIPQNYHGQDFFFLNEELEVFRIISCEEGHDGDYGDGPNDWLPLKHKKDVPLIGLHPQLDEAIQVFLLIIGIRWLRGQKKVHNTMMVNVSRFNDVQLKVTEEIKERLTRIQNDLRAFGALPISSAVENSEEIKRLSELFHLEYSDCEFEFDDVLRVLADHSYRVKVEMVNLKASQGKVKSLDYEAHKAEGYWVIAVGGLKLSRGLTLEDLSVSFFLRNALAYDTLTQMCRWFGYRGGFEDLLRLYLLPQSLNHYVTVAQSIKELYEDLRVMEAVNGTPKDFGLKVRSSETALLITAKNKMGSGEYFYMNYDLWGSAYGRLRAWSSKEKNAHNFGCLEKFVSAQIDAGVQPRKVESSYVFDDVDYRTVSGLINDISSPISGPSNSPKPVIEGLNALDMAGFPKPKVVIFSRQKVSTHKSLNTLVNSEGKRVEFEGVADLKGLTVNSIARTYRPSPSGINPAFIYTTSASVGDSNDLKTLFQDRQEIQTLKDNSQMRKHLDSPVLMIYLVSAVVPYQSERPEDKGLKMLQHGDIPTVVYILHFPFAKEDTHISGMSENKKYLVNEVLRGIEIDDIDDEDAENEPIS